MSQSGVLSLIVVLWLFASGALTLGVERRAARQQERPVRRWLVVSNAIGLTLVVAGAALIGLKSVS